MIALSCFLRWPKLKGEEANEIRYVYSFSCSSLLQELCNAVTQCVSLTWGKGTRVSQNKNILEVIYFSVSQNKKGQRVTFSKILV